MYRFSKDLKLVSVGWNIVMLLGLKRGVLAKRDYLP